MMLSDYVSSFSMPFHHSPTSTTSLTPTKKSKVKHESRKNYFKLTSITKEGQKYYFVQIRKFFFLMLFVSDSFFISHATVTHMSAKLNCSELLTFHSTFSLLLPLFDRSTPMLTTRLTYEGLLCHTLSIVMCVKPHARTRKCCSRLGSVYFLFKSR